jgi:hypothetical protein
MAVDELLRLFKRRCERLILDLDFNNSNSHITIPLCRYIMCIPYAIPIKHIVLGERPYATDILPYAASALSYDPMRQKDPPPSVEYLAHDLVNNTKMDYDTAVTWFRDSWKFLLQGVLLLNVCTFFKFNDVKSEKERVYMEEFLRDIVFASVSISQCKVHVYAMGNPAQHSANRIKSSMINLKHLVAIHRCINPAALQHKYGDQKSQDITLKSPTTSRLLSQIIISTLAGKPILSKQDYYKMTTLESDFTRASTLSDSLAGRFDEIFQYFRSNDKLLAENTDLATIFQRAGEELRELSISFQSIRVGITFMNKSEPSGTAKSAYYNQRKPYNKSTYSTGTSSRVSSSASGAGINRTVGFGDESADESSFAGIVTPASTTHQIPTISNILETPTTPTPATITKFKPETGSIQAKSVTGVISNQTVSIGFGDSSSDASDDDAPVQSSKSITGILKIFGKGNNNLSEADHNDMSLVSDFLESNNEYDVSQKIKDDIGDTLRNRQAGGKISQEILATIRNMREDSNQPSVENALGYEDGKKDVLSDIIQLIMKLPS